MTTPMLTCKQLSVYLGNPQKCILNNASAHFALAGMHAVIGPSGCGKTTLVKAMLSILPSTGHTNFQGQAIESDTALSGRLAFVPQFSIAAPQLTVAEVLSFALELQVLDPAIRQQRFDTSLERIGLEACRDTRVANLSGGQLRRLGLGIELIADPDCIVCDEVTSGLDPRSEDSILEMLQSLRDESGKAFICIIHNLNKLDYFDTTTVVYEGAVVFQGHLSALKKYFSISDPLQLYDRLSQHTVEEWNDRWAREQPSVSDKAEATSACLQQRPKMRDQVQTLLKRRALLFVRDRAYWMLTLSITLGFPLLVAIFAWDGLPELRGLALTHDGGFLERIENSLRFRMDAIQTASLVTGLILFQVILLTLIGSNNGAREIAAERTLYEKERFAGLNPYAYAISKLIFSGSIACLQGLWMTVFVKTVCDFPGPLLGQSLILILACFSMTLVCLGLSAVLASAEKASLLSVYLVGFQLPLSGIVLALPEGLVDLCRPFIIAYWAWAGYFATMIDTRLYDAFRLESNELIPNTGLASLILGLHAIFGAFLVFYGCIQKRPL